ncbi:MAG: prepilin-type N-terminal cleavage/methylation domain-containing protein [Nitrospirae bacterium]|nr:prepilin-type N-terminal cleavage/methylation domain-containing protein [Nitrospirota bacterium]
MKATHYKGSNIKGSNKLIVTSNKLKTKYSSLVTRHSLLYACIGFTLLEVMIALAIVGAVSIVIIHTVNYHAEVSYEHTIKTRMVLLAREKITNMEIKPRREKGTYNDFFYETIVSDRGDGTVELKAIVKGYNKEVVLSEIAIKK